MNTFDDSKPDLISGKTLKDIETQLDTKGPDEGNRVLIGIGSLYENYILPNLFSLLVIILLAVYLTIKYILKKDREERELRENAEEAILKRIKNKNHMLNIDHNNKNTIVDITNDNTIPKHNISTSGDKPVSNDNVLTIGDMISDDYLLTDDDDDDDDDYDNDYDILTSE